MVLLDNGHGGFINGQYTTAPKKMHIFPTREVLYEGVYNREIVNLIAKKLKIIGVPYKILTPENEDIALSTRVTRANKEFALNPNCYLVSVHANAGGGTGIEIFTSKGQTKSDLIASLAMESYENLNPSGYEVRFRKDMSDGDSDKEEQYYILRKTACPAILTENFFFDNYEDYKFMISQEGKEYVANSHVDFINKIHQGALD